MEIRLNKNCLRLKTAQTDEFHSSHKYLWLYPVFETKFNGFYIATTLIISNQIMADFYL